MPSTESYPGTQAVHRALNVLKAFTDETPELSLAEIAQVVGLNKTTAYRLLTALESQGMVSRKSNGDSYRLGSEAIVLGGRALRSNSLRTVSRPELELLAQQSRETATIEIISQGQVLILDEVSGEYLLGAGPFIGSHWPLHATATGKTLLAYLPQEKLNVILKPPLARFTEQTITSLEALHRELKQTREQGYAIGDQELEIGFTSVSAPIFNLDGQVIAAISVGGSSARLTQETLAEIVDIVKDSASRISRQLGFRETNV